MWVLLSITHYPEPTNDVEADVLGLYNDRDDAVKAMESRKPNCYERFDILPVPATS